MRLKTIPTLSALAMAAVVTGPLFADVKPNPLFTDGAVLQRGQPVPVWGTARDGEKVTVEFAGQKASVTAADGKWSVSLKPLKEGGPHTMTITGDNAVTVNNLLVGEVWVCSGNVYSPHSELGYAPPTDFKGLWFTGDPDEPVPLRAELETPNTTEHDGWRETMKGLEPLAVRDVGPNWWKP